MALLKVEAEKLSNNQLERGIIEEIIDRDELFALVPFSRVNGKAYVYNRENTLSEADFLDPNESVNEGAATFTEVVTKLKIMAGDVDVDKFLIATMGDTNDQLAIQLAAKAKGITRKFRRTLAIGDEGSNAKEFNGVRALTPNGQTMAAGADGAAVTASMLDELKDMVKNGADALMMRAGTWRAVRGILRAAGGNEAMTIMMDNFGYPVRAYDGTPVIINDFLPANEVQGASSATCSIYAMRLNETDGMHGIYGGSSAGVVVEEIGTVQNKDAVRWRVKWYAGTALKSTQSIARLKGISNI
jgi:hypothetical protein